MTKEENINIILAYLKDADIEGVRYQRGIKKLDIDGRPYTLDLNQTSTITITILERNLLEEYLSSMEEYHKNKMKDIEDQTEPYKCAWNPPSK